MVAEFVGLPLSVPRPLLRADPTRMEHANPKVTEGAARPIACLKRMSPASSDASVGIGFADYKDGSPKMNTE